MKEPSREPVSAEPSPPPPPPIVQRPVLGAAAGRPHSPELEEWTDRAERVWTARAARAASLVITGPQIQSGRGPAYYVPCLSVCEVESCRSGRR